MGLTQGSASVPALALWDTTSNSFQVRADLGRIPPGVVTIMVWAKIGDERETVSQYSIFHGVGPPDTYSRTPDTP